MRVNEIFYSLQGEGHFSGTPAVFLRLSGCNLRCPFCDTNHEAIVDMTEEEIVGEVSAFPARHIVITGGEPAMQLTASLTAALHAAGFFIQIETNGTIKLAVGVDIDWITCSPKERRVQLDRVDELKVLFMNQDVSDYLKIPAQEYRLQPLDSGDAINNDKILADTIAYILANQKWKLSLQTHKLVNIK